MTNSLQRQSKILHDPVPPTGEQVPEGNICGVLVHVRPQIMDRTLKALAALPGTEIHQSAPDGRVVATVEDVPGKWAGNTLTDINNIQGVLSAALVFHHRDGDDTGDVDEEVSQ